MFKSFDPLKDKLFQILDPGGNVVAPKWMPDMSPEAVLDAYKLMRFARLADEMAVSFQRQGRMFTYPPNLGQEAIHAAVGTVIRDEDWLVPAYREMGAWLSKGAELKDIFLYWGGYEDGASFSGAERFLPPSVPIASQLLHAVGVGYALNYRQEPGVVFVFVGDGGTSEGDFHEALNFAGVWRVPVVFIIQNNQYAISLPVSRQTASRNLAMKAMAYGMPGIKVDGNDVFAMIRALQEARDHAQNGKGPVLIEGVTFRLGAHTTSDDPTLYRSKKEEKQWAEKEPIKRLKIYLEAEELWSEKKDQALLDQYRKEVEKEFSKYEQYPAYPLEDVFKYQFQEMPDSLKKQKVMYETFLKQQEKG